MSFEIRLPSVNGDVEAGITVGVDSALPQERKLPILFSGNQPASHAMIKENAVLWALGHFRDQYARSLYVNGIIGILDVGLVCYTGMERSLIPDGDWVKSATALPITKETADLAMSVCNREDILKGLTVAIATKANFWLMNHHIGQGAVAGYVKKVLDVFYQNNVSEQVVDAAYALGHFTSTLAVLTLAEMRGIRPSTPITHEEGSSVTLSDDSKLRFSSMPAGTHRLGIAYEAARRLVRSVYATFCPDVTDFAVLPGLRESVMSSPASYHIGASYLTGEARADYSDTTMQVYLGRLGTFIMVLYKQSTLAKSPHMVPSRVESYEDYDADFRATLARVQAIQSATRGRLVEEQVAKFAQLPEEDLQAVRQAFKPVVRR